MYKIAIVGEAYGEVEEQWKRPFVGPAGDELNSILRDAGILREECFITNVFNLRPSGNAIESLCTSKTGGNCIAGWPAVAQGKYIRSEYQPEIDRLLSELREANPNVVLALGNTATWALLKRTAVGKLRGAVALSPVLPGLKVLPTYHPAAIMRQYENRSVTVLDFMKAKRESEYPEVRRRRRELWLDPTLEDLEIFYERYCKNAERISFDIETSSGQITCIGFAPTPDICLVVPFWDYRKPNRSYWETTEAEVEACDWVQKILATSAEKVGQNGLYDIQYLWMAYGIWVNNYAHDTMLLHHSLQPELPKGLDFLGSVYCDEPAWKQDRPRGKQTIKREE